MSIGPNLTQTPINVLQQAVLGQVPSIQPASALGELNNRVKTAQMQQAAMGQNAMQQNAMQQQQPPVAASVLQAAQGIDHPGYGFAGGGIVAFADGGPSFGYAPEYELARKYGIVISPYDSPEVRQQKLDQAKQLAAFDAQPKGEIPNEYAIRNMVAGYTDPNRARLDAPTPSPAAAPTGGIASVAPRPQAAPRPQGGPATPQDDFMQQLKAQRDTEQGLLQQAGTLSPELIKAREDYEKSRVAGSAMRKSVEERRMAELNKLQEEAEKQKGVSPLDNPALLAALAGGAQGKTLGAVLSGAAGAGGAEYTRQQKEARDVQDKLRAERMGVDQLTLARMDYDAATQQAKVAELTGDRDKMMAAQIKMAEAQRHLLDVQQRYVQAKEHNVTQLKAAEIGAAAKGAAQDIAERKLALASMRQDPEFAAITKELTEATKQAAQIKSTVTQERLLKAQQAAVALARKHGATPQDIVGVSSDTSGASPGAQADPLGIRKT